MGSSGLEPPTSRLSGARSSLLSYEPLSVIFLTAGFFTTHNVLPPLLPPLLPLLFPLLFSPRLFAALLPFRFAG